MQIQIFVKPTEKIVSSIYDLYNILCFEFRTRFSLVNFP